MAETEKEKEKKDRSCSLSSAVEEYVVFTSVAFNPAYEF